MTDSSSARPDPTPDTPGEREAQARRGYSSLQIAFHWTVVALVLANWLIGDAMSEVFEARLDGAFINQWGPAFVHIAIGLAIFGTMAARLAARLRRPVKTAGDTKHPLLARLGMMNHWALYAVLLLMPPLGAVAWFGGSEAAGDLHGLLSKLLVALVLLHVGGAVVHLLLGENIFRRILRPTAGT